MLHMKPVNSSFFLNCLTPPPLPPIIRVLFAPWCTASHRLEPATDPRFAFCIVAISKRMRHKLLNLWILAAEFPSRSVRLTELVPSARSLTLPAQHLRVPCV